MATIIIIMGQQQITDFFYEFSFLLFPHHLLILKNDMKLIQVYAYSQGSYSKNFEME